MQVDPTPSSLDEYMDLLRDVERRRLLLALLETGRGESVDLDRFVSEGDRQDLEVALYHVHIPKLSRAGLIDCKQEDDRVHRGPAFDDVVPLLEVIEDYETH